MTSLTVTATQGGSGNTNGIVLDVRVVTGAAAVQNGKTGSSATITTPQLAITPNATGSWVYVSIDAFGNASTLTANAATTLRENVDQSGNPTTYGTGRTTSTTTAATPVTVGASAPTGYSADAVQLALAEILAAPGATLAEDASTPAVAYTTAAETVTTGSFSPPPGSLLVAIVAPNSTGAAGIQTITVSDSSGLTWTPLVVISSSGDSANGIWVAVVPPAPAVIPALPGPAWRHRFQHRQVPGLPPPVPPASGPLLYPLQQPAGLAQRAPGPFRAGRAQGRQGTFSGQGPRLTPLQQPVASRGSAPGPQRYGRAAGNAGTYAPPPPTSGPPLTPLQQPCGNRGRMPGPARYGRVQGISGGTFSGHGPAVTPLQCPAGIGYRAPGPARTGRAQGSPGAPYTATPPQAAPPQAQPGQTWLRQHRRHQLPMLPPPGTAGPRLYPLQQPVGQNVRCTIRPFFRGGTGHATPLPPKPLAGVFLTWLF
jgi:hypothetical protein